MSDVELWWHAFSNRGECCGITTTVYAGESTEHPEALVARLQTDVALIGVVCFGCKKLTPLDYVRSWNHEPSRAECRAAGLDSEEER